MKKVKTLLISLCLVMTAAVVTGEEKAPQTKLPKVLIIGDSISMGYTGPVIKLLKGKAEVKRVGGNCKFSSFGVKNAASWIAKGKWDIIHFNFGLWDMYGWKQKVKATPETYAANLDKIVTTLKTSGARLVFGTTTPNCKTKEKNSILISPERHAEFAKAALAVMKKHQVKVNDLCAVVAPEISKHQLAENNVHYNKEASMLLAKQVAKVIEEELAESKK